MTASEQQMLDMCQRLRQAEAERDAALALVDRLMGILYAAEGDLAELERDLAAA